MIYTFYNCDCIAGAQRYMKHNSVDLIICDPPYGIQGDTLHKHYNRDEKFVLEGYVEVPLENYQEFSIRWIQQAERILKPGGSMYIVSGYTNLYFILRALRRTTLQELNHIIWKYNFGVYTKKKFVSGHYHILYYKKPGAPHTFNTFCRFADFEKDADNGSLNYQDREDVWYIKREYKRGSVKNKNELPTELLTKMIQYSTNPNDMVCDMFLGSFSTAKVSKGLGRNCMGFELNKKAFEYQNKAMDSVKEGYLLKTLRKPVKNKFYNSGKPLTENERQQITSQYEKLQLCGRTKKESIYDLSEKFGRGFFSIQKCINDYSKPIRKSI